MRIATNLFVYGKLLRSTAAFCMFLLAAVTFSALPAVGQQCLEIRVLDPSSTPMLGASVSIGDREESTDADGRAMFCDLGDGPYAVTVSAPNFQMVVQTVDHSLGTVVITLRLEILSSEIVVVGTRSEGREPLDSPVPVELVPGERLRNSGHVETVGPCRCLPRRSTSQAPRSPMEPTRCARPRSAVWARTRSWCWSTASGGTIALCYMFSTRSGAAPPARISTPFPSGQSNASRC